MAQRGGETMDNIMLLVAPAYGRDYGTAKALKADWEAGKDFTILSGSDAGRYINKADAVEAGTIFARYSRLRKVTTLQ